MHDVPTMSVPTMSPDVPVLARPFLPVLAVPPTKGSHGATQSTCLLGLRQLPNLDGAISAARRKQPAIGRESQVNYLALTTHDGSR